MEGEVSQVRIGPRTVEIIVDRKRWKGRSVPFKIGFRVRFRGEGPIGNCWYHRRQRPHCHEHVRSYLAKSRESLPESRKLTPAQPSVATCGGRSYGTTPVVSQSELAVPKLLTTRTLPSRFIFVFIYYAGTRRCTRRSNKRVTPTW